jgi:hypothetical protein
VPFDGRCRLRRIVRHSGEFTAATARLCYVFAPTQNGIYIKATLTEILSQFQSPKRKGNVNMKYRLRFSSFLLLFTMFSGCEETPTSVGTEPYSTRLNDLLGIRLGMSYDDFVAAHPPKRPKHGKQIKPAEDTTCVDGRDNDVFCTTSISYDDQPKIGDVRIVFYSLKFYQKRLIDIDYSLVGYSWEPLINALNDKFGEARSASRERTWQNSVSKVLFTESASDFSAAHLKFSLSKETHEWLEQSREREKAETEGSL